MLAAKSQNGRFFWTIDKGQFSETGPLCPRRTLSATDTLLLFDVLVSGVAVTSTNGTYTWSINADGCLKEIGPDDTSTFPKVDTYTLREMFLSGVAEIAEYVRIEATGKKPRKPRRWKYDDEDLFTDGVEGVELGDG
jgi:hypothetical protein